MHQAHKVTPLTRNCLFFILLSSFVVSVVACTGGTGPTTNDQDDSDSEFERCVSTSAVNDRLTLFNVLECINALQAASIADTSLHSSNAANDSPLTLSVPSSKPGDDSTDNKYQTEQQQQPPPPQQQQTQQQLYELEQLSTSSSSSNPHQQQFYRGGGADSWDLVSSSSEAYSQYFIDDDYRETSDNYLSLFYDYIRAVENNWGTFEKPEFKPAHTIYDVIVNVPQLNRQRVVFSRTKPQLSPEEEEQQQQQNINTRDYVMYNDVCRSVSDWVNIDRADTIKGEVVEVFIEQWFWVTKCTQADSPCDGVTEYQSQCQTKKAWTIAWAKPSDGNYDWKWISIESCCACAIRFA